MKSEYFKLLLVVSVIQMFTLNSIKAQGLLFDNGPFVTNTAVGFGGSDVSVMQLTTLGYSTFGYSVNNASNFRLTDQFTNSVPWYLDYVDVYAYQTGSSVSSTFTGGVVKIWNSDPSSGTALTEFGDFTTNRMTLTNFSNCYRVQENTSLLTNNRPIMRIRISIGAIIQPGTHWIEWGLTGTLASGPFAPNISILGTGATGDAKQFNTTAYSATLVNGTYSVGIPFKLFGSQFISFSPSPNPICPGSNVTVNYLDPIVRNIGNTYTLELSDVNGNFPGTLLTTTVVSANQLSAVIPLSTVGSTNYKIRTVASSPSENSSPSNFLNVYPAPNAVVASQTNVSCFGGSNGTATVSPSGGTPSYTYSWAPSGGSGTTASGLAAGTYIVTVTDANSCTATQNFNITQPIGLVLPTLATLTGECSVTPTAPVTNNACSGIVTGTTTTVFPITTQGTTVVTWSFNDGNGQTVTANQTVIVDDTTPPVVPTLANVTGQCSATPTAPTTTDNCAGTITGTTTTVFPITTQGTTVVTWSFNDGNGQTVTANQTVIILGLPTSSTLTVTSCGAYTSSNGNIYPNSGTYTETITNVSGCDSTITIQLTVQQEFVINMSALFCKEYTVPSGTATYYVSGIYNDTLTSVLGCDSILVIDLTILPVDNTVTQNGLTLTSNAVGAQYHWINCNTGAQIFNATNQSFTPIYNGSYAVVVLQNGCYDTSICYTYYTTELLDEKDFSTINIYPNPSNGLFTVQAEGIHDALIDIYDMNGRLILEDILLENKVLIDLSDKEKGVYFIRIEDHMFRLVVD